MAKQCWELLADGWRYYEASLGSKRVSKAQFAEQIGVNPKVFRDWLLRPTRAKDSIPIKYIDVIGKAMRMSQDDIDAAIAARIKERATQNADPDFVVLDEFVMRSRRNAAAKAIGGADAKRVLDIFRRAQTLHDGELFHDMEEAITIFAMFEQVFMRTASLDDEERVADSAREDALPEAERQARAAKRERVLGMLRDKSKERANQPSQALRDRQEAHKTLARIKQGTTTAADAPS